MDADTHEKFLKSFATAKTNATSKPTSVPTVCSSVASTASVDSTGSEPVQAEPKFELCLKTKVVIAAVRKQHGAWDKQRRDNKAVIELSKANNNTVGCKFESDIAKINVDADKTDKQLMDIEATVLQGSNLTDSNITEATDACKDMATYLKRSREIAAALRTWFKVPE